MRIRGKGLKYFHENIISYICKTEAVIPSPKYMKLQLASYKLQMTKMRPFLYVHVKK